MIDRMLSVIAPHLCCGCGKIGSTLCGNCKYDIVSELKTVCIRCQKPCGEKGICASCHLPYSRAWCVGERQGSLQRLIGLYKFERVRSAYKDLGDLLSAAMPDLPAGVVIVPIPTVAAHIRQRGYDHTLLLARYIARKRQLPLQQLLVRLTKTTQRQESAAVREAQAKAAFAVKGTVSKDSIYLLIDDVMTTGATLKYATKALQAAGATQVWVAVVARQTLD